MIDDVLLRFNLDNKKFLIWDFETESVNTFFARPWQIYYALYHGKSLIKKQNFYLKWPDLKVSPGAAAITGFNQKIIDEQGVEPIIALENFNKELYKEENVSVGHNILGFDCMIHNVCQRQLGLKQDYSYLEKLIDTHCLSKAFKLGWKKGPNQSLLEWQFQLYNFRQKGLKTNVALMATEFEIPFDAANLHKAEVDVPVTFEIFKQLVYKVEI